MRRAALLLIAVLSLPGLAHAERRSFTPASVLFPVRSILLGSSTTPFKQ